MRVRSNIGYADLDPLPLLFNASRMHYKLKTIFVKIIGTSDRK